MIPFLVALVVLSIAGLGVWFGKLVARMLPAIRSVMARSTTRIGDLKAGPAEVSGKILTHAPVRNLRGQRCAIVEVEIHNEWSVDHGKQRTHRYQPFRARRVAPGLSVRDSSGRCRLAVDTASLRLSADPVRRVYEPYQQEILLERCPAYRPHVIPGARVTVLERSVRIGRRVMVLGQASLDEQAEPQGYREGTSTAFKLGASPTQLLLISRGTQGQTLARLSGPLVLGLAVLGVVAHLAWGALMLGLRI
ncbi:MAG: hypothetical protein MUF64_15785 [Polyangiaceae bacterium]|jgi:hypothetical protein|nr:hypothetical protein [Polyangiaceae bacterium]